MKLYKQDVSKYSEKKGQFTYLSWAHAWSLLKKTCPDARYGVTKAEDGSPFFVTQCGFFVDVWVEVDGLSLSQIHPVLDNRNQPIEKPNAFHISHHVSHRFFTLFTALLHITFHGGFHITFHIAFSHHLFSHHFFTSHLLTSPLFTLLFAALFRIFFPADWRLSPSRFCFKFCCVLLLFL